MDHAIKCASMIAYLEGLASLPLPKTAHDLSLSGLEKRTAALERHFLIESPPPFETASWNGLVWRVWRLRDKNLYSGPGRSIQIVFEQCDGMIGDAISMEDLHRAVANFDVELPALKCPRCEGEESVESGSEQACLGALAQKLSYISAVNRQQFPCYKWTKNTILLYAALLSFTVSSRRPGPRPYLPPPNWPTPNGPAARASVPAQVMRYDKKTRKSSQKSSSNWLRKLMFWQKKKAMYSDSSSSSSREIID